MAYSAAVQAVLDRAGVRTLEEWNAAMSQGTASGVNAVQRAAGHDLSEGTWTRVEDASALAESMNRERAQAAAVEAELARKRDAEWTAYQAAQLPDMSVPSVWNPTPTNYNPDPLGRTDLERQQAEIAAADAAWNGTPFVALTEAGDTEQLLGRIAAGATPALDTGYEPFTGPMMNLSSTTEGPMGINLGSIAKGIGAVAGALGGPAGGAVNLAINSLMNSRRDEPPAASYAPGVPGLGDWISNPWEAAKGAVTTGYQAGQAAVNVLQGAPGQLGGVKPKKVSRNTLVCPTGYALAIDGVCYPKSQIPKQLRKWKPEPRPVVSRSDQKAITRSAAAKKRLVKITKASGAFASLSRPHHHHTTKKK